MDYHGYDGWCVIAFIGNGCKEKATVYIEKHRRLGGIFLKTKVLMVGRNRAFVTALEKNLPNTELYVLEEPDLHERHQKEPFTSLILKETRTGTYQQSDGLVKDAKIWNDEIGFDAVVPGVEYAVMGAGRVAQELGLPYLGKKAVSSLTNKLRLRELCRDNNIPHPRFTRVQSLQDVHRFFEGDKIVIKPANRQASAGVIKIEKEDDIEAAYEEMIRTDEGHKIAKREMKWEFMAEEYLDGIEVSVETLVQNGQVLFHNVTEKTTTEGRYFVELGHVLPASLPSEQIDQLLFNQKMLVFALQAENGFLHAEWKFTPEGPKLIECAGRAAGDFIMDLIEIAYGFNIYSTLLQILSNQKVTLPQDNIQGACIRFFEPSPGVLKEIHGIELLEQGDEHLDSYLLTAKPGDQIYPINSSWARVGHVIVKGKDSYDAKLRAEDYIRRLEFIVE
ncbi:ATP-grasp domain-containing protein [Paenibacillus alvei]|uniref:ATP-grasp domain-containing protein n=1 Tax=Paenibacillus alvei TaxID=44250 RepID=A0AAP7DLK8_PAEAL|nr:ATP-grasp domain-containing protein [Paenibacillus alvei]NOJ73794.1 ATP-grasp domain-containing protein [Paenibacillus alvei]